MIRRFFDSEYSRASCIAEERSLEQRRHIEAMEELDEALEAKRRRATRFNKSIDARTVRDQLPQHLTWEFVNCLEFTNVETNVVRIVVRQQFYNKTPNEILEDIRIILTRHAKEQLFDKWVIQRRDDGVVVSLTQ